MPDQFGRYELHDLLGRGGMGEVYRAYDTIRDRTVALKLLPRHLAEDESFKIRFRRESQMAARLHEPHIIPIHDFGEIDGTLFIDMRLVDGEDLGTLLTRRGPLSLDTAVSIIGQVAAALDAAHASDLVHRDVKPSNVLLTGVTDEADMNPFAYLVDFGIARSSTQEGTALTATSGTIGTVAYMSPERIGGEHGDRRTDIYALACVLYEVLTGRKPFEGELFAIMYAHVNTPPPAVSDLVPDVPDAIDEVVRKGMAKNPDDRFPTAGALATAARQALRAAPGGIRRADRPAPTPPPPSGPFPPAAPSGPLPPAPPPWSESTPHHSGPAPTQRRVPAPPAPTAPGPQWLAPPPATTPTPPGHWQGPGPSGPLPPVLPRPGPERGKSRRTPILVGGGLLVAAAIAIVLVLALGSSGGNSPAAKGSTTPAPVTTAPNTTSAGVARETGSAGPSTPTSSGSASLDTGPPGTSITWAHFASFSKLLGTTDNDTSHAFDNATCSIEGSEGSSDIAGIVDQVKCTMSSTSVVVYVARFGDAAAVNDYVWKLLGHNYGVTPWKEAGQARGLAFSSPSSATSLDITTTVCGLPNYLVQFYVPDASQSSMADLHARYWNSAVFPDVVPPACRADFLGAANGTSASPGATADKQPFVVDEPTLNAFLARRNAANTAITVPVTNGSESMLLGQTGDLSFWTLDLSTGEIRRVGQGKYPYNPGSLGPPNPTGRGVVLDNMDHPTFIVNGTFSTDGAGNAIAFANAGHGWKVVKAQSDGNLAPSGNKVGSDLIGLSQAFDFHNGDLLTADCSQQLPISQCHGNDRVIKYWTWNTALGEFVQTGSAGRSS